ncbi:hypothetical protein TrST_g5166 [Triparma strigata]|uniref:Uncharacterized protein n=1 Tax=Triparma strigata TaxID=1606541 RepID=A0A9W6ZSW5_9STRA|nr:hypothetical protein TrST_g5166 [Triparma strigata]
MSSSDLAKLQNVRTELQQRLLTFLNAAEQAAESAAGDNDNVYDNDCDNNDKVPTDTGPVRSHFLNLPKLCEPLVSDLSNLNDLYKSTIEKVQTYESHLSSKSSKLQDLLQQITEQSKVYNGHLAKENVEKLLQQMDTYDPITKSILLTVFSEWKGTNSTLLPSLPTLTSTFITSCKSTLQKDLSNIPTLTALFNLKQHDHIRKIFMMKFEAELAEITSNPPPKLETFLENCKTLTTNNYLPFFSTLKSFYEQTSITIYNRKLSSPPSKLPSHLLLQ